MHLGLVELRRNGISSRRAIAISAAACIFGSALPSGALAASPDEEQRGELASDRTAPREEDITVTATRGREQIYGQLGPTREVPRTVVSLAPETLRNDPIVTTDDFAQYAPGISRMSVGGVQLAPVIRGQAGQIFINGIQLASAGTETVPLTTNAYESADIGSGPAGVVFGPTSFTSGYVNFITKQPYFDDFHGSVTTDIGSWDRGNGFRKNLREQIDVGGPLNKDRTLAYRVSIERRDTDTYYGGWNNYTDAFVALSWNGASGIKVDWSAEYNHFDYNQDFGWNRVTQDLVDKSQYLGGAAIPIIAGGGSPTGYYSPVLDASGRPTGHFVTRIQGIATAGPLAAPGRFTTGEGFVPSGTGSVFGYVLDPVQPTRLSRRTSMTNPDSIYGANNFRTQLRLEADIGGDTILSNITSYERTFDKKFDFSGFSRHYRGDYLENRTELRRDHNYTLFGLPISHSTNSGVNLRFEWVRGGGFSVANYGATLFDLTSGPADINAIAGQQMPTPPGGLTYDDLLYGPGVGIGFPPTVLYRGIPVDPTTQGVNRDIQIGFFSQHKLDFGSYAMLNVGGRVNIYKARTRQPLVAGEPRDSGTFVQPSWTAGLTVKPTAGTNLYVSHSYTQAVNGGTPGVFTLGPDGRLRSGDFHSASKLTELGIKSELIREKLFLDVSGFWQQRQLYSAFTQVSAPVKAKGIDATLRYYPSPNFTLGLNAEYIDLRYQEYQPFMEFINSPLGVIADGQTVFNCILCNAFIPPDNYRIATVPKYNVTGYADYRFANGLGAKTSFWFNSAWYHNFIETVRYRPSYSVDLSLYYDRGEAWRIQLNLENVTDRRNFSTVLGGSGDQILPLKPFNIQGRVTYRF